MKEKLEARRVVMETMSMLSKVAEENAKKQEERLSMEVRSLLVSGTALSVARRRLQVILIDNFLRYQINTGIS